MYFTSYTLRVSSGPEQQLTARTETQVDFYKQKTQFEIPGKGIPKRHVCQEAFPSPWQCSMDLLAWQSHSATEEHHILHLLLSLPEQFPQYMIIPYPVFVPKCHTRVPGSFLHGSLGFYPGPSCFNTYFKVQQVQVPKPSQPDYNLTS